MFSQPVGDRYYIEELLGGGEVTEVYRVRDIVTGKHLVMKTVRIGAREEENARIGREFYCLSQISHPGVVTVYDYGLMTDNRAYFMMEYISGIPITRYFSEGYNDKLIDVIVQVLLALDAIHAQGMIHCDLKPEHILIVEDAERLKAKLLDFGFAEDFCFLGNQNGRGTPGYVAPEILKGVDYDVRSDLYALGVVIYETLTGIGPGRGGQLLDWLRKQQSADFAPPRSFNPAIPETLDRLVMRLIAPYPEQRPRSAQAVIEDLVGESCSNVTLPPLRRDLMACGFVARDQILEELKGILRNVANGQSGVVCISGDRGVGKSRLLSEFKFFAELEGATVFSYEPASLGARSQSLVEALILLLRNYGLTGIPAVSVDRGKESNYQLFEWITQHLKQVANSHRIKHSLVIIVDDFELFDPTSLEFLRYLALGVDTERLLLVVTGLKEKRFLDTIDEIKHRPNSRHLVILPFNRNEVKELTISLLSQLRDIDTLADWLFEFTGGNPLWIVETIYALMDVGILVREVRGWDVVKERLLAFRPPAAVSDTIRQRLEALTPEESEVLEIAAAAAGPFTLELLRATLSLEEKLLFRVVNRLKALGFLRPFRAVCFEDSFWVSTGWTLSSKILESVIVERLTVEKRRENHRRVALALELLYPERLPEMIFDLAHHWTMAGVRERAYDYSLRAGVRARELLLFEQALVFYENALTLSPGLIGIRDRIDLLEKVGEMQELTGRFVEAVDLYRQGMGIVVADPELTRDKRLLARFLWRLGLVYQKQGIVSESVNLFNQALHLLPDEGLERTRLLADLGWSYCSAGDFSHAENVLTSALQLAEKQKSSLTVEANRLVGLILYYFGVLAWAKSDFVLAAQLAERSLDVFERLGDEMMKATVSQFVASIYLRRLDREKAKEFYLQAVNSQRRAGAVYYLCTSLLGLGLLFLDNGEWDKAEENFNEALKIAEQIGDRDASVQINTMLGVVWENKGAWLSADNFYKRAQQITDKEKDKIQINTQFSLLCNIALLKAKQGELEAAEEVLSRATKTIEGVDDSFLRFNLMVTKAEVALRGERLERAKEFLTRAFWIVVRDPDWQKLAKLYTLSSQLRLTAGDAYRAQYAANRALTLLREYPSSLEFAIALRYSGVAKCKLDQIEKGWTELKRSIEILRQLNVKYELALSLNARAKALVSPSPIPGVKVSLSSRQVSREEFNEIKANLREARGYFQELGAKGDLQESEELLETLEQTFGVLQLKAQERGEYLKVFYQLSELLNLGLGREDFLDRVLDLVLSVTKAERGLIFLIQGNKLIPVAARDIDHRTLEDATAVSQSVLRKVKRRGEPLISADAVVDPRFNNFNSVLLNKIRSLLCVPLVVEGKVIGTIYLDSRITSHLFVEEDRSLLVAVANLLAATIDRSTTLRGFHEEVNELRDGILIDAATGMFLGRSKAMRQVYQIIDRIAPTDCTVLLTGETGTGKGVLARLIHQRSGRKDNKFVAVNCGTLPETLFESELFGHAKGSFTGAIKDKVGIFETAHGGTIFLDEITNTTLTIQAKLLQVLEEKTIRRVGETELRMVDVRLICATNKKLAEEVKAGRFREDIYYRMNVVTIEVPPLRDRVEDIPHLADFFVRSYATQLNKHILGFEPDVITAFTKYHWPGNVRELQNAVERAVIMTQNRRISLGDVGKPFTDIVTVSEVSEDKRRVIDKEQVINALRDAKGNITRAAERLSTHRRQLQRLIKRYQIDRNSLQ
ncbi:MAG: sigma 54-interacting transcriptional regulator [bacterium]